MAHEYHNNVVTLDTDWAPDIMIDFVADLIKQRGVKATWFSTHDSPALRRLMKEETFEIGIHPNFFPNSSQGKTADEIIDFLLEIAPKANTYRPHSVFYNGPLFQKIVRERNLVVDSTFFLPFAENIQPTPYYLGDKSVLRVPYFWADDYIISQQNQEDKYNPGFSLSHPGLKVYCFHPVHVYLNSTTIENYESMKSNAVWGSNNPDDYEPFVSKQQGVQDFFIGLLDIMKNTEDSIFLNDIYKNYFQ